MLSKSALLWLGIALGSVGLAYVVYLNQATLILLGISFVVAYLLDPSIDRLERRGLSRTLAISLLIGVILVSVGVFFLVIIPQLQSQVRYVAGRAPHWGQWLYEHIDPLLKLVAPPLYTYFGIVLDIESLKVYAGHLSEWVMGHLPGITQRILSIFQSMFTGFANFIVGALNILLVPVLIFYLLRDFDILRARFYTLLPPHWRPIVADWLGEIDRALGGFLRGQFTIALILATIYAIGLALIGVPFGALLGIIAGLANLVPYMSIVVGLIPTLVFFLLSEAPSLGGILGYSPAVCRRANARRPVSEPTHYGSGNGTASDRGDDRNSGWWNALWPARYPRRSACHGCSASRATPLARHLACHLAPTCCPSPSRRGLGRGAVFQHPRGPSPTGLCPEKEGAMRSPASQASRNADRHAPGRVGSASHRRYGPRLRLWESTNDSED